MEKEEYTDEELAEFQMLINEIGVIMTYCSDKRYYVGLALKKAYKLGKKAKEANK